MLTEEYKKFIKEDSLNKYPNECCGLIFHNSKIVSCPNSSETPENSFIISEKDFNQYNMNNICGFYHSHKDHPEFSLVDVAFSEKLNKICALYVVDKDIFLEYKPNGVELPYENRPFFLGVLDCFTLFQDYYRRELNIKFETIQHKHRLDYKFWTTEEGLKECKHVLEEYFLKNNFTKVNSLQKHDIILIHLPNIRFPIHILIYLGNNLVLHHVNKLSKKETYNNRLKRLTTGFYRHSSLL